MNLAQFSVIPRVKPANAGHLKQSIRFEGNAYNARMEYQPNIDLIHRISSLFSDTTYALETEIEPRGKARIMEANPDIRGGYLDYRILHPLQNNIRALFAPFAKQVMRSKGLYKPEEQKAAVYKEIVNRFRSCMLPDVQRDMTVILVHCKEIPELYDLAALVVDDLKTNPAPGSADLYDSIINRRNKGLMALNAIAQKYNMTYAGAADILPEFRLNYEKLAPVRALLNQ